MFGSSNQACEAWKVFDATHNKNIVSWNAMLSAHSQNGHFEETIAQMALTKMVKPNKLTFACANLKNLREGKLAHAAAVEAGLEFAVPVAATLIQMYSKCHCLEEARDIFSQSPSSDVVAWTVMISAYAQNCRPQEAIALFRMTVPPDSVAFATVGVPRTWRPGERSDLRSWSSGWTLRGWWPTQCWTSMASVPRLSRQWRSSAG
ncbi:pentatricopeptide repeat-containing protein At1g11290, chloroplastic [Selaginella moellendorffii]|uniref:pentatricopeptide repeat-containing protein At1g11290, chloroplastic n=1 Tax=Selaginella moellendorffii TaxID=88036 RepID=UPI000D1CEE34|nr:pentatricopeptide repeat-containing protein At1g11290, chloroplastic [Selaginella moellendorffii]|eukprot:XP_024545262.1 pentatricopeptide repeat-containing protein At1g11290, chloroplastic [Selaginella moellendorffii]